MREVLFRGKWTLLNEWLEGDLIQYSDAYQEIRDKKLGRQYPIDPSTGGQFSGLTDKNGKKIFEGDVVKYKNTDGIKFNGVALTVIGKVVYNEKNASFAISGKDEIGAKHYDYFPIKNIEIVGNIHDNPELLEAKQ